MNAENLHSIINRGEGINIEFKECKNKFSQSVFETICAFLNRNGGHLLLGVADDKTIIGIEETAIEAIKKDFTTAINNNQLISPTYYLQIEVIQIHEKNVLYIYVPESSHFHRFKGRFFDRNEDGDFDITNHPNQISNLILRKQSSNTEDRLFPHADINELDSDVFKTTRIRAEMQQSDHPFTRMSDIDLLKSCGFYVKDPTSGRFALTLGGILVFGNERLIQSALPHHRTDALLRRRNLDRYDDRDDIRENLIKSYERMTRFVSKHLDDRFYLSGDQRINLRDAIYREAITNTLIHREYANPFPAKMIIYSDRVMFENSSRANGYGQLDLDNFAPYPKNPRIAKFFKEIGLVDELGSGIRNIYLYNKIYAGADPKFIEGDIFTTIIPLTNELIVQETTTHLILPKHKSTNDRTQLILDFCVTPKSRQEIQDHLGIKDIKYFREHFLNPLVASSNLFLTEPSKPISPKQKYFSKLSR